MRSTTSGGTQCAPGVLSSVSDLPTLDAERLRLEPLALKHSVGMFELWSAPEVCEYSGVCHDSEGQQVELPAASRSQSDRLLRFWLDRAAAGTGFRWAVVLAEDSRFVGALGFNALGPCAEYAYHFTPLHWGKGLASEASQLALSWVFGAGSESVEAFIDPGNLRSLRLVERLGFGRAGRSQDGSLRVLLSASDRR
jgi:ribosomal-protein-alanine N-acetyltransferase